MTSTTYETRPLRRVFSAPSRYPSVPRSIPFESALHDERRGPQVNRGARGRAEPLDQRALHVDGAAGSGDAIDVRVEGSRAALQVDLRALDAERAGDSR